MSAAAVTVQKTLTARADAQAGGCFGPLVVGHGVLHRVTPRAVTAQAMLAPDALALRTELLDRCLGPFVLDVGVPGDTDGAERLEGVAGQEQLRRRVVPRPPPWPSEQGVADGD